LAYGLWGYLVLGLLSQSLAVTDWYLLVLIYMARNNQRQLVIPLFGTPYPLLL